MIVLWYGTGVITFICYSAAINKTTNLHYINYVLALIVGALGPILIPVCFFMYWVNRK